VTKSELSEEAFLFCERRRQMPAITNKGHSGSINDLTSSAMTTAQKKADDATEALGGGMRSLAGTLREKAPMGGTMGQMASTAATTLDRTGRYLQEEGLSGMTDDVMHMVRKHPLPALAIALGAGFFLAQLCSSGRR